MATSQKQSENFSLFCMSVYFYIDNNLRHTIERSTMIALHHPPDPI